MSIANTNTETIIKAGIIEDNDQVQARVEHLKQLESLVGNSYPNKFERSKISGAEDTISNLLAFAPIAEIVGEFEAHKKSLNEGEKPDQELKAQLNEKLKAFGNVRISGRLAVPPRVMGKAAFVHLSDGKNRLQIYVRRDDAKAVFNGALSVSPASAGGLDANDSDAQHQPSAHADDTDNTANGFVDGWEVFKLLDHGDFVGAEGFLFLTNTGELSVHVETFQFLSKSLLPMPDKMHGIADPELRRRYRYADLIASSLQVEHEGLTTREVFERRAKLISGMRRFLDDAGYIEVETPMLSPKATGAAATPFETYHNALDIPLYARIAPELYLKRLTVGGFEKVYELNRNFRNEGLSHKHNPEFTMLEFYCAYMDVNGMMDFAEEMIKESVQKAVGSLHVKIKHLGILDRSINFADKFMRLTMKAAIIKYLPQCCLEFEGERVSSDWLEDFSKIKILEYALPNIVHSQALKNWEMLEEVAMSTDEIRAKYWNELIEVKNLVWEKSKAEAEKFSAAEIDKEKTIAQIIVKLFEGTVEDKIIDPTFIIDYPKSISPLSKASPENPQIAERFELFINGMECANGFSELNDPQEQFERFVDQMKEREGGDAEAMVLDEDYIRALAYGMPPAAGIGIGIDRLVMLLTDKHSIRDVILFPHMRPERKDAETAGQGDAEKAE
ncbi:MAG TPA: lysine--tRNA ligase [Pyrinomonadaceae bacterium]|nr:lysine--tRNA ligase [Pyrinomonadaceae bacterium]